MAARVLTLALVLVLAHGTRDEAAIHLSSDGGTILSKGIGEGMGE